MFMAIEPMDIFTHKTRALVEWMWMIVRSKGCQNPSHSLVDKAKQKLPNLSKDDTPFVNLGVLVGLGWNEFSVDPTKFRSDPSCLVVAHPCDVSVMCTFRVFDAVIDVFCVRNFVLGQLFLCDVVCDHTKQRSNKRLGLTPLPGKWWPVGGIIAPNLPFTAWVDTFPNTRPP